MSDARGCKLVVRKIEHLEFGEVLFNKGGDGLDVVVLEVYIHQGL
jgi:hypothetical protein